MILKENQVIPFEGLGNIKLYSKLEEVKSFLDVNNIKYFSEIWSAEGETIPNPWTVLFIENSINLYFAGNDKLFKIYCYGDYKGSLPNGINLDTDLLKAKEIDTSIEYNDDGEDYESNNGYWIEDNLDTGKLLSITIFIKELLNDDVFDGLKW